MKRHPARLYAAIHPRLRGTSLAVILVSGVLGIAALSSSHAVSFVLPSEAENGSVAAPASVMADTAASAGQAVRFGAAATPTFDHPFSADSPWNAPIPPNSSPDPNSNAVIATLTAGGSPAAADAYAFGIPIYSSGEASGRFSVRCLMDWGACPFTGKPAPLAAGMKPHTGSDGAMVVVDTATGDSYEYWQYDWNGGSPQTSWGAVMSIYGNGIGAQPNNHAVAAGTSRLAGVVRLNEVKKGVIPHALVFSSSLCKADTFRYPAWKTDGRESGNDKVEEGMRFQLDPTVDVDAIAGITPIEKMVAKALQTYGIYAIDCGGSPMAISFELDPAVSGDISPVYKNAGLRWDYDDMPHIPWAKLRVLKSWNGQ